jgi:hypothetical protein
VNVGEKSRPRNGQVFVQYAGLWGRPGRLFITSGYWGPAANETGATCADGQPAYRALLQYPAAHESCAPIFIRAWCDAMAGSTADLARECRATSETP